MSWRTCSACGKAIERDGGRGYIAVGDRTVMCSESTSGFHGPNVKRKERKT